VVIGRIFGWFSVILAFVMASAEAVMALGTGAYNGLATSEVLTLLVGDAPGSILDRTSNEIIAAGGALFMAMPAWLAFAVCGFMLVHVCRKRPQRKRRFRTIN
jgi:putative Ca2+/H+ antiporter (TMEM165/GDT1 family)